MVMEGGPSILGGPEKFRDASRGAITGQACSPDPPNQPSQASRRHKWRFPWVSVLAIRHTGVVTPSRRGGSVGIDGGKRPVNPPCH